MYKSLFSLLLLQLFMTTVFSQSTPRFKQIDQAFLQPSSPVVLIAAHRGAHLEDPENSMAAFRKSIELGIDIIELDVRCTKDGVLVCMHDKTVNRTTNGTGPVDSFTFAEIRQLKLKHNGQSTNEQIPTLEEALLLTKGKILVDLDIKSANCIESIMATVEKTGTANNCMFFLGEAAHVKMLKGKNPAFRALLRTHSAGEADSAFQVAKPEAIHIDPSHNQPAVIARIKQQGARVWNNALGDIDAKVVAGDIAAFEEVLMPGANIIQTDQPALLKAYLIKTKRYYPN
ncbi:glycerophosphodiester phosphodiesterase family protein [Paraflavitalea pollutisoli]|uniref:glycerophosphodiester phosphodiesterase family protein n=1 Tax=Paraflavitalea pollutisoli TaxID=3034143 RepID=UPI0023EDC141|nr:glycerophosphodiester phosphodiesterase family protein [Paraflavitalea sp. H1-2-19X]